VPLNVIKFGVWCAIIRRRLRDLQTFRTLKSEGHSGQNIEQFLGNLSDVENEHRSFQQHCTTAHAAVLSNVFGDQIVSRKLWPTKYESL